MNLSTCTGECVNGYEPEHLNKGLVHPSTEHALIPPPKNHLLLKVAAILTVMFWNQCHIMSPLWLASFRHKSVRFPHKVDRVVTSPMNNNVCLPFELFVGAVRLALFEKGLILLLLSYDIGLSVFIWFIGILYVCQM